MGALKIKIGVGIELIDCFFFPINFSVVMSSRETRGWI